VALEVCGSIYSPRFASALKNVVLPVVRHGCVASGRSVLVSMRSYKKFSTYIIAAGHFECRDASNRPLAKIARGVLSFLYSLIFIYRKSANTLFALEGVRFVRDTIEEVAVHPSSYMRDGAF